MTKQILNAQDVASILEVSSSKAYSIIRQLNGELKERGFLTVPGKVSRVYFEEKLYGVHIAE
ncbi:DNA-binding protein [bacterium 1XD21-13]|nr:DNA-binding protein [bacterium 1XD21-13]